MFYTTKYKHKLLEKIKELEDQDEIINTCEITQDGEICRLNYSIKPFEIDTIETFAQVICDIVQTEGIIQVTKDFLMQRKDLLPTDKKEIKRKFVTNNYLAVQEGFSALTYYLVYMPLLEALKENQEINIDGWLRFRTYRYKVILADILEQFVEDYLLKKDIIKFIKMVKEMSPLNNPLEDVIHLIYKKNGEMSLHNEYMEEVTELYTKAYCEELLGESSFNKEDLIMNILITICPRRIIVHQRQRAKYPQFIKTLEGIFGINMRYCKGCENCTDNASTIKS
ncbi:sporulation protein YtxC [Cellulosilyticum sp. I15G10I2]|uniref:sporulation protein YtxC n=1 Tax=Cellulosilyticum sp. I15G10I2 TaxID=1892843 RepID=UPI001A9A4A38|nr:sporulation protein YtxC [Cellulosilyticum sp. I15G10I2]